MARLVTVELLVDMTSDAAIADLLNEHLRPLQHAYCVDMEEDSWLVDYRINFPVKRIPAELEDAIVNDTYEEGDAWAATVCGACG